MSGLGNGTSRDGPESSDETEDGTQGELRAPGQGVLITGGLALDISMFRCRLKVYAARSNELEDACEVARN
jgi:hypothetical protein